MFNAGDHAHMARALQLAGRARYDADPNPAVGCVIVAAERVVGEGWTARAGGPHAERGALAAAGESARGATAYVTLEPCCHVGRTGPCTQALIEAGVARVVYALDDPNPRVAGRGAAELRAAGIDVESGLLAAAAAAGIRGFISRMTRGRPWVRAKIAASLDGRTALANGSSQWITGTAARADVHRWRARSSAVLTGVATILADDPSLDARPTDIEWPVLQPMRVILDSRGRLPATARTLRLAGGCGVFTCGGPPRGLDAHDAWLEQVPATAAGHCDLDAVMRRLAAREINDVWVEAGATLNGALLAAGLIDELIVYLAPTVLGHAARSMFAIGQLERMSERIDFEVVDLRRLGRDLRLTLRPTRGDARDVPSEP
jgi:diaminohydroxyphosphoribosylaminopyrimidine deaminase / 5-amino-6-(5-phosphoribosylamino)uracil reductase